jgi:hypothetical protein
MPDKYELEYQKEVDGQRRRLWAALMMLERWMTSYGEDGMIIKSVTVQPPATTGRDWRAIIKGVSEDGSPYVSFANGASIEALHLSIAQIGQQKGFKWREDLPYQPKQ